MDKSAVTFQENPERPGTHYTKVKPDIGMKIPFKAIIQIIENTLKSGRISEAIKYPCEI